MQSQAALLFLTALISSASAIDKIVCYYQSWTAYSGIQPEDLNPNLCTHINYAFISLTNDGSLTPLDQSLDIDQGLYNRIVGLKQVNPDLKVLLSIGGGNTPASLFSSIAADPAKRSNLVNSGIYFLETYGFDGLDIDWEIPEAGDRENFIALISDLRNSFDSRGWLITAATRSDVSEGYDVVQMDQLLDFVNIMSYDFYGPWSQYTGQNSPLYASSVESDWEKANLNVAAAGEQWSGAGLRLEKVCVGIAFYGRSFTLADPNQNGLHAPITGPGQADEGAPNYHQICTGYGGWNKIWDDEQKNPIKTNGNQWLGYDDPQSIQLKVQHIGSQGYGGVMIWAISGDDVHGDCGTNQELLKIVNDNI